ncbi:MAG: hypothetical protein RIC35_23625 [Marinoscillum sp.]
MKTIKMTVKDKAAANFEKLSESGKQYVSQVVNEMLEDQRSLKEVMGDMSEYAQKQGLTPEILDDILSESDE